MKKRTWQDNILFLGLCCVYVALMSACVHMLSFRNNHENVISNTDFSPPGLMAEKSKSDTAKEPEADTHYEVLAEKRQSIQGAEDNNKQSEIIGEIEDVIEYDPEFLASVRGKDAEKILHPVIIRVANEHEIDPALIKSIIWAESSFNPKAVSKKGAVGLMQLMPATAASLGIEDSLNPESNIDGGVRYFKKLLVRFKGDAKLALAAYNAGSRKVLQYNGVPPFEATQYYIEKVFEYYEGYKQFEANNSVVDQI